MTLRPIPVSKAMIRRREAVLSLPVWDEVKEVVDLGCGHGVVSNLLVPRGLRVIGVDRHPVAAFGFQGKLVLGEAETVDLPSGSADLVLALELIEHLPTRAAVDQVIANMKRITRQWMLITVPHDEQLENNQRPCPACGRAFHVYHHFQRFTPEELRKIVDWPVAACQIIPFPESGRTPRWLVKMRNSVGLWPRKLDQTCAFCGAAAPPDPSSISKKILQFPVRVLGRLIMPWLKPNGWILALFEKPGSA